MKNVIGISLGARQHDFDSHAVARPDAARAPPRHRRQPAEAAAPAAPCGIAMPMPSAWAWPRTATAGQRRRATTPRRAAGCAPVQHAPVSNGARLADILLEWAVRHAQASSATTSTTPGCCSSRGLAHQKLALSMAEYTPNLRFADPLLQLGVPKLLTSLERWTCTPAARTTWPTGCRRAWCPTALLKQWARYVLRRAMAHATWWWRRCTSSTTWAWRNWPARPSITTTVNDERLAHFSDKGVHLVIDGAPLIAGPCAGPVAARRDDPGRHRQVAASDAARRRLPRDPGRRRPGSRACCTPTASSASTASPSSSTRCRRSTSRSSSRWRCCRACRRRC